jgi:hypothetical protein
MITHINYNRSPSNIVLRQLEEITSKYYKAIAEDSSILDETPIRMACGLRAHSSSSRVEETNSQTNKIRNIINDGETYLNSIRLCLEKYLGEYLIPSLTRQMKNEEKKNTEISKETLLLFQLTESILCQAGEDMCTFYV